MYTLMRRAVKMVSSLCNFCIYYVYNLVSDMMLIILTTSTDIDGAYFGTTFPHLFLMTYPYIKPSKPTQNYTPRIFGFKLHKSAR